MDEHLDIAEVRLIGEYEEPEWSANPAEPACVVGLDHVYISVSDFARSERFYDGVMQAIGFRKGDKVIAGESHAHYFNPFVQLSIRPARSSGPHDPYGPRLHHLCYQAADEAGVNEMHARLTALGIVATPPHKSSEYIPNYYATYFEADRRHVMAPTI